MNDKKKTKISYLWDYIRTCHSYVKSSFYIYQILMTILNCISPFIFVIFPSLIINELMNAQRIEVLIEYVLLLLGIQLSIKIIVQFLQKRTQDINTYVLDMLNYHVNRQFTHIAYPYMENQNVIENGNLAKRCIGECGGYLGVFNTLSHFITNIIVIAGVGYITFEIAPVLLLVTPICLILKPIIKNKTNKIYNEYTKKTAVVDRKYSNYFGYMLDFKYGKDIRMYNMENLLIGKAEDMVDDIYRFYHERSIKFSKLNTITTLLDTVQTVIFYLYAIYKIISNAINVSNFVLYLNAFMTLHQSISGIIFNILNLKKYAELCREFSAFMAISDDTDSYTEDKEKIENVNNIQFENVTFCYPGSEIKVLDNVNLTITNGKKIAFVGKNGAGKTTMIKLLLRYFKPTSGRILLNGIDIQSIPLQEYYEIFSVIFQDYQIYSATVRENILMKDVYSKNNISNDVITKSGLADMLNKHPLGLETMVHKIFDENGINPSMGEAQKIAIARAIYKAPDMYIFDEPAASLDPISEYDLYQSFMQFSKGKAAIFISHRLSSCRFCDSICVLEAGSIIEEGSHEELIQRKGLYAKMFELQAEHYKQ